jgi:hypothetical protein
MESHFDTVLGRNDLRVGQDEFQHEIRVRIMNNEMRNFLPVFHFEMLNILTSRRARVPLLFRSSNPPVYIGMIEHTGLFNLARWEKNDLGKQ